MSPDVLPIPARASASRRALKILACFLGGAVVLLPVALAARFGLYHSFIDEPLNGWGMWGTFAIHMALRPSRREQLVTVLLGLVARLAYDLAIGERGYPGYLIIGMGIFLGFATLVVIAYRSLVAAGEQRTTYLRTLAVLGIFWYLGVFLAYYTSFAKLAVPRKLDYYLFSFDGSLGFQPSVVLAKVMRSLGPFYRFEAVIYDSLGFWFAVLYAAHLRAKERYRLDILRLLVVNPIIGFSLYFLFPAAGPAYAFPSFPIVPAAVRAAPAMVAGIPNAMPSLHFSGALLICWCCQPWKWLYRISAAVAALTAVATLGLGEHYFVDLVVAVPYSLAMFGFCAKVGGRTAPLAAGASMVLLWMALLRYGHFSGVVSWLLVVSTIVICAVLQRRLAARLWTPDPQ